MRKAPLHAARSYAAIFGEKAATVAPRIQFRNSVKSFTPDGG